MITRKRLSEIAKTHRLTERVIDELVEAIQEAVRLLQGLPLDIRMILLRNKFLREWEGEE